MLMSVPYTPSESTPMAPTCIGRRRVCNSADGRQVGAGQLAELHPKQWDARRISFTWIEVFLDNMVRGARRKRIAFSGEISPGDRLGYRCKTGRVEIIVGGVIIEG